MELIYVDSLFFINLLADYLLLLASARICGVQLKRLRYLAAAVFGAVYSVAVFLPSLGFLSAPLMKLVSGLAMGLIAFAAERRSFRCTAVFLAVSAAFGGALWAAGIAGGLNGAYTQLSPGVFIMSFALCYSFGRIVFRCRALLADKRRASVTAAFLGREASFTALVDSGNSLSDPVTGSPVMVACPHALQPIFLKDTILFSSVSPVELLELTQHIPELRGRLRLIPYTAVGSSGLLPVFRPDKVCIDGTQDKELLIAVSPNAAGDGFEAII